MYCNYVTLVKLVQFKINLAKLALPGKYENKVSI